MEYPQEARNKVRRIPARGHYDKETVYGILDAGYVCHVGFQSDERPVVIPTLYGRDGDGIYLHGSTASRMLRHLARGVEAAIAVTHVDGLVLARSAFHHSINYRSAVIFGRAVKVTGDEKVHGLFVISENVLKGRWDEVRTPSEKELAATTVLRLDIEIASAKIRTGPPSDEEDDYSLPIWAGVLPIHSVHGPPEPDPRLKDGVDVSPSVNAWSDP